MKKNKLIFKTIFLYEKVGFKVYEETKTHYKMKRNYKNEVRDNV